MNFGLLCLRVEVKYGFMRQQQKACAEKEISRRGYYQHVKTGEAMKADEAFGLLSTDSSRKQMVLWFSENSQKIPGRRGHPAGRYRARPDEKAGVPVAHRQKLRRTTNCRHNLPVASSLRDRNFQAKHQDSVWCGDIIYYLSVDNRRLSISGGDHRRSPRRKASLVTDPLSMAYGRTKVAKGLIRHSDRGSRYAGGDCRKRCTPLH